MVDTDVRCAVGEEGELKEAAGWSYFPVLYLKVRKGSSCRGFRWANSRMGIAGDVAASWDHRVEVEADW